MFKNVATQYLELYAYDYSTGAPKTGDAANLTAYLSKDAGALTALGDTSATEISSTNAPGWYRFDLTQAETNFDNGLFSGKSSTANVVVVGSKERTLPPYFTTLGISATGAVAIQSGLKRNTAGVLPFTMRDSTGAPLTGATVTVSRSIDSATSFTTIGTATEKTSGWYHIAYLAADVNGGAIALRFAGTGGSGTPVDNAITVFTDP